MTPTNGQKKTIDKDISMTKLEKKNSNKTQQKVNGPQVTSGQVSNFWRNKAVSPPSKPLSPLKQVLDS